MICLEIHADEGQGNVAHNDLAMWRQKKEACQNASVSGAHLGLQKARNT